MPAYSLARCASLTKSSTSSAWASMRRSWRATFQGSSHEAQTCSPSWGAGTSIRFSSTVMRFISLGIWKVRMRPSPESAVHLHPVNAPAAEDDPAAGRRQRPGHQVEERRLARTVGADQPRDGARHDLQGAVVHGPHPAEVLDHVAHLQHGRRLGHVASLAVSHPLLADHRGNGYRLRASPAVIMRECTEDSNWERDEDLVRADAGST